MLNDFHEKGITQLLEPKDLKNLEGSTDPKYCRHHGMIGYSLEKYIMLKEHIM